MRFRDLGFKLGAALKGLGVSRVYLGLECLDDIHRIYGLGVKTCGVPTKISNPSYPQSLGCNHFRVSGVWGFRMDALVDWFKASGYLRALSKLVAVASVESGAGITSGDVGTS